MNAQRAHLPMPAAHDRDDLIYSDEYIETCAERFVSAGLRLRCTFAQYLANPKRYDNGDASLDPLPLNARQQRIRARLIDDELSGKVKRIVRDTDTLPRRNGKPVEVLHHHRHPKSVADFIPRSKAK